MEEGRQSSPDSQRPRLPAFVTERSGHEPDKRLQHTARGTDSVKYRGAETKPPGQHSSAA